MKFGPIAEKLLRNAGVRANQLHFEGECPKCLAQEIKRKTEAETNS